MASWRGAAPVPAPAGCEGVACSRRHVCASHGGSAVPVNTAGARSCAVRGQCTGCSCSIVHLCAAFVALPPEPSASATASTTATMCVVSWRRPDVCFTNRVCLQITTTRSLFARATKALARAEELDRDVARGSPSLAKCAPFPDSVAQEYAQVYYHFGLALCMKFHTLECARMLGASAMAPCSVFVGGHSRWCDHRQGTNPWP